MRRIAPAVAAILGVIALAAFAVERPTMTKSRVVNSDGLVIRVVDAAAIASGFVFCPSVPAGSSRSVPSGRRTS